MIKTGYFSQTTVALLVLILLNSCDGNFTPKAPPHVKYGSEIIFGKVKNITLNTFYVNNSTTDTIQKGRISNGKFNTNSIFGPNGYYLEYNRKGLNTFFKEFSNGNDIIPSRQLKYKYDEKDRLVQIEEFDDFSLIEGLSYTSMVYDDKDLLIKQSNFNRKHGSEMNSLYDTLNIKYSAINRYNSNGILIEQLNSSFRYDFDTDSIIVDESTYKYDVEYENGKLIAYNGDKYEYHPTKDYLVKKTEINKPENYKTYYENGTLKSNVMIDYIHYEFDKNGYFKRDYDRNRLAYEAKYDLEDKLGNWTRKILYYMGRPVLISERTIEYYE
ncbi:MULTISPECIES: hypothetical protein [Flavobacteriaceae]|uniref:hypothetical protein n=1 Tax=Flavobacteriaceae TaxID=49546 RepID=UPI0014924B93|nr:MULTISPECIES: hypothetical protein [Allomuricauda]MDC6364827.1 hypothetical protein [Muricauda sp. AC10]